MVEKKAVKIKVEDLVLIFGKNKEKALELLRSGATKSEILRKTHCTVGVNRANFEIYESEFFVLMGLSGSGKSTLLRCLNRLIEPTAGNIYINGDDVTRKSHKALLDVRRTEMSMVFQKFGLLPHRTILENVAFGLELRGESKERREEKAQKTLDTVGLHGFEHQFPAQLSGGMQQRVGLARALTNAPEVLLMDEAFSALDPLIRTEMQDELIALQDKLRKTIVFVTHDLDEAIKLGDRIAIMKDGVIEQIGSAEEILTNPATAYVAEFVKQVDRKTIITAGTLMHKKPTVVRLGKDGPEGTLRKMRATGLDVLPVVDDQYVFKGFVWVTDVIACAKKGAETVQEIILTDVPTVATEVTVEQMLPLISATRSPIGVVDMDSKHLLGIVSQNAVVIEATRYDEQEIAHLQKLANNN